MKHIPKLLLFLFISFGSIFTSAAQQVNCYGATNFKTDYKIYRSDIYYDFTFTFCRAAVRDFEKTNDTDKVLLMTMVKNVGDKKGVGTYKAAYKITDVKPDEKDKDWYYFTAKQINKIKVDTDTPDVFNPIEIGFSIHYDEYLKIIVRDKGGRFFTSAVEDIDDDSYGW